MINPNKFFNSKTKELRGKYKISKDGQIYSLRRKRLIKVYSGPYNTLQVTIGKKNHYLHRLLAETFIPNPEQKHYVIFKDGNKNNISVDNLAWKHIYELEGNENRIKLTEKDVEKIRLESVKNYVYTFDDFKKGFAAKIAKQYNIENTTVYSIIRYKTWKHVTINKYDIGQTVMVSDSKLSTFGKKGTVEEFNPYRASYLVHLGNKNYITIKEKNVTGDIL